MFPLPLLALTGALVAICAIRSPQEQPPFRIFTQPIDVIGDISVTLSRLNSINAIDVTRC